LVAFGVAAPALAAIWLRILRLTPAPSVSPIYDWTGAHIGVTEAGAPAMAVWISST
jgi:hypothetical protein